MVDVGSLDRLVSRSYRSRPNRHGGIVRLSANSRPWDRLGSLSRAGMGSLGIGIGAFALWREDSLKRLATPAPP